MTSKKRAIIIPLLLTLLLVGCDGGGSTTDGESGPVELTFWHTMGQANQTVVRDMIANFKVDYAEKYPGIKITDSSQGGYDDLFSKIKSAIPAGTTPTMAFCYPDHVAHYIDSGAVENLQNYVDAEVAGFADDFVSGYWNEGREYQNPGLYSVPFSKSTEALFYNKTFFDMHSLEVPTTWNEMLELCRDIKAIAPNVTPLGYDSDSNLYITLSQQLGIPYTSSNPETPFLFNNNNAKEMVTYLKDLYDEGLFVTKGASPNNSYTSTQFTEGKAMMTIGSTGGTSYNQSPNFDVGVAIPPSYVADEPAVISQGPSITIFSRFSARQKEAAWDLYKYISNTANSARYSIMTGYEPVRTSSYATEEYQMHLNAEGANANLFTNVAKVTYTMRDSYFFSPVFVGSAVARDQVGGIISNVLLGTKNVEEAFQDALIECVNSLPE